MYDRVDPRFKSSRSDTIPWVVSGLSLPAWPPSWLLWEYNGGRKKHMQALSCLEAGWDKNAIDKDMSW